MYIYIYMKQHYPSCKFNLYITCTFIWYIVL